MTSLPYTVGTLGKGGAMYTERNFLTKKALKMAVSKGEKIKVYQPGGIFPAEQNGEVSLEGPHSPAPHTWYARATITNGVIVRVS